MNFNSGVLIKNQKLDCRASLAMTAEEWLFLEVDMENIRGSGLNRGLKDGLVCEVDCAKRVRNDGSKQKGFTLLEVLISLILLSFILLGFDAMQIYSLRITQTAYYTHVASEQINSIIEILHTPSMINQQLDSWNLQNAQLLPLGKGEVIGNSSNYQITVSWINASIPHCIQRNIKI